MFFIIFFTVGIINMMAAVLSAAAGRGWSTFMHSFFAVILLCMAGTML